MARSGPYDVTLDFGQRVGADGVPEYEVRVSMSWEHAQSLLNILETLIDRFEETVGPLPDVGKVAPLEVAEPAEEVK
jgi:hypothetical protein